MASEVEDVLPPDNEWCKKEPTPAFGHPSREGMILLPSREGCRVSGGVGGPCCESNESRFMVMSGIR